MTPLVLLSLLLMLGQCITTVSLGLRYHPLRHWGQVSVEGTDRLKFLHGLGTNSFEDKGEGDVVANCFLNAQGKLLYYNDCYVTKDAIKFICEPEVTAALAHHLNKFIFPADKVKVHAEEDMAVLYVDGGENVPDTVHLMATTCGAQGAQRGGYWELLTAGGMLYGVPVCERRLESGSSNGIRSGVRLIGQALLLAEIDLSTLTFISEMMFESERIRMGRPAFPNEINNQHTPLEAGLMSTLHFRKGCFVGNEIIAKTVLTNAVRQKLVGLEISLLPEEDCYLKSAICCLSSTEIASVLLNATILNAEDEKVGYISSVVCDGFVPQALAYIRTKYANSTLSPSLGELRLSRCDPLTSVTDSSVDLNDCRVRVRFDMPLPRFDIHASPAPPQPKLASRGREILVGLESALIAGDPSESQQAMSPEEQRRAAKLAAMAAKVTELQNKKKLSGLS